MSFQSQSQPLPSWGNWLYEKFLQLFIYPSLWVSAGIASLVYVTQETLSLPINWQAIALIFAIALLPYNLDRIIDSYVQKIPDEKAQAFFRKPGVLLLLLAAGLVTATLLYQAPSQVRWVSCGVLVPLLYGAPIFPIRRNEQTQWYRLKDIPGTPAWIVSGTITYAVVAVPLAYAGTSFSWSAALLALFYQIFIGTNSHVFDVRDVESDKKKGASTLPILVGVKGTRLVFTVLNLIMLVILSWGWSVNLSIPHPFIVMPATLITLFYLWKLDSDTPRDIYNIWIDGCLFLPALLTGVLKLL